MGGRFRRGGIPPLHEPISISSRDRTQALGSSHQLSPGALNQIRRIRWNIEKAFNQQGRKLDERKAWSASEIGKRIQALAICLARNFIKLFHARAKTDQDIENTKVINAWNKDLVKRIGTARQAGRQLPGKLCQALCRPAEAGLRFIRFTAARYKDRPATDAPSKPSAPS